MLALYEGCLIIGVLFAIVTVIFGDLLSNALDGVLDFLSGEHMHALQPTVLVSGLTVFGGAGMLLELYSGWHAFAGAVIALAIAVLVSAAVYFLYVKPMNKAENSVAFSLQDLVGKVGSVTVPIPAEGFGEVVVKVGAGLTNQTAVSFEHVDIEAGAKVVTVEVKDRQLFVARLDRD